MNKNVKQNRIKTEEQHDVFDVDDELNLVSRRIKINTLALVASEKKNQTQNINGTKRLYAMWH